MPSQFCESEDFEMEVATPGSGVLPSTRCFFGVDVEVVGRCLPADLRVLKMVDYDVIFSIDWLRRYRTHVQCFERRVVFGPRESLSSNLEVVVPSVTSLSFLFSRLVAS